MIRRAMVCVVMFVWWMIPCGLAMAQVSRTGTLFTPDTVTQRAREMAEHPFTEPDVPLPKALRDLDYDQYRRIQYLPTYVVPWSDAAFRFRPFHRGHFHADQVRLNIVTDGRSYPWRYDSTQFQYDNVVDPSKLPADLGYAGFKVLCRLNRPDRWDELISFLGASYFRALGQGQVYGTSCRGLAIDTGLNMAEEFPYFREFWVAADNGDSNDSAITIYALMDSQSLTGSYQFIVTPGKDTTVAVHATIFARKDITKLGIAPLTSMYHHGKAEPDPNDYRPEVHDADGLLIAMGDGHWVWRVLRNPAENQESYFVMDSPRGFGLIQRERDFAQYQDFEAHYHQRPSIWIEPIGSWGKGTLDLMELHDPDETFDSVVAQWTPEKPLKAGQSMTFDYRMTTMLGEPVQHPGGRCVATRRGFTHSGELRYVLDFTGPELAKLAESDPPKADVLVNNQKPRNLVVQPHPYIQGWRVSFDMPRDRKGKTIEMLAKLVYGGRDVTETWSDRWP
ncbi:MAG: glucan biosynthesis protein G [Phycisphaeraceae bacterium]